MIQEKQSIKDKKVNLINLKINNKIELGISYM